MHTCMQGIIIYIHTRQTKVTKHMALQSNRGAQNNRQSNTEKTIFIVPHSISNWLTLLYIYTN